ncbi:MAG: prolipoprotein diacylglyceryl transferase [Planctomycetota bacterium]|jgi:phosphatidylglycerol:prolipoprotein diacylglycerol transferase
MCPRIGPVATYGILYLLGIIAHFLISRRAARRLGLRRRVWIAAGVCYMVGMTAGAKYLLHARQGAFDPAVVLSAEQYRQGGLWGGLLAYMILAIPAMLLLARKRKAALDLAAVSVPVPWAISKLGCLLNGCCHGRQCSLPWAIVFPQGASTAPAGVPTHPTQIYEVLIMASLVVLFTMLRGERWRGTMLLWLVGIYGIGRAATDVFRGDADRYIHFGPVTLTQLVCVAAAVVSIAILLPCRRITRKKKNETVASI